MGLALDLVPMPAESGSTPLRESPMMKKTFAILANSVRKGCRCIAGRELLQPAGQSSWGPWIRPVSQQGEGEISDQESACSDGTQPAVLDVVEVSLAAKQAHPYQPENYLLALSSPWRKLGVLDPERLPALEEQPAHLWFQRGERRTDRIHSSRARHSLLPFQTLYLIRPASLRFRIWEANDEYHDHPHKHRRAIFIYNGVEYDLPITDPTMDARYFRPFPALEQPARVILPKNPQRCRIVASLAAPFKDGYHYKVAATILEC